MGLCTDIVCFLTSVYLYPEIGFSSTVVQGVCMHVVCMHTAHTIFQLMSGERREIEGISIGF